MDKTALEKAREQALRDFPDSDCPHCGKPMVRDFFFITWCPDIYFGEPTDVQEKSVPETSRRDP